jgi:hypothetical protein
MEVIEKEHIFSFISFIPVFLFSIFKRGANIRIYGKEEMTLLSRNGRQPLTLKETKYANGWLLSTNSPAIGIACCLL